VRTHALLGVLLVAAALALPSSADGQSFTLLSVNLSFELFGGARIRMTHHYRCQGYGDYCWEEARRASARPGCRGKRSMRAPTVRQPAQR
jgi:hypothetical protein